MTLDRVESEPFESLPDVVRGHAVARPDALAFACDGQAVTWAGFASSMDAVASACLSSGLATGDKVALLMSPSLQALAAFFGVVRAGGCVVPLASSVTAKSLAGMIDDCDARILVVDSSNRAAIEEIEPALRRRHDLRLVALGFEAQGWTSWERWLAVSPAASWPTLTADQAFNIIYSSGTTGDPKGILHLHGMRYRQAARRNYGLDPSSVMLLSTPLYSNTTLQPLLATVANGGAVVLMPKFNAERYLELADEHRATHTMLVPVQFQRLLDHERFTGADLTSFKLKQCTGAPLDAQLKARILAEWPGSLREIYGMTEGGCTCVLDADVDPDKLGTVGKPAPLHDIRVIDDAGHELPAGQPGEVVGRSPFMMAGYYKRPEATEAIYWRDAQGRVFHRTGDIGRFDGDGFLQLLDRKKDVIISGGFNIYASDLEGVLAAHPDVLEAAVIGIPSVRWGETPMAVVVRRGGSSIESQALLDWVNGQVGRTQRLSAVEFRSELPRSALGKVLKRELRQPFWP